jgi:hypothetical protein
MKVKRRSGGCRLSLPLHAEHDAWSGRWLLDEPRVEDPMASHDAPVKTPAPSNEPQDRFEWMSDGSAEAKGPVLNEVDARQGVTGHNVRYVLAFGLVAVIVTFAAILAFDFYR